MGRHEQVTPAAAQEVRQSSSSILMVEPACFGFNPETAASNCFSSARGGSETAQEALREFHGLADRLEAAGVSVFRLKDSLNPPKPDAAFPNNWISFHSDGTIVTYPMEAPSRRLERRVEEVSSLLGPNFEFRRHVDLSASEASGEYLEGTGSLILDRPRARAYASLSSRTHPRAVAAFDRSLGFSTFTFGASDPQGRPIYHTNVLMSLGTRYALLCTDTVAEQDRTALLADLEQGGRTLIEVDYGQLLSFTCNIIELADDRGNPLVAMSSAAFRALRQSQRRLLEELAGELVHAPIPTIEAVAGGSVRCMIADIHLPKKGAGAS
ncbi:MAG TPA: arginine deiminase-related protein [Allosphingosinicella sp.]|nr:arginine deiminase-related protein [Allosphingosinicella sp.]